ncbi:MAG: serine hydrolase [Myxococcales bacterium]|nr:serine hydrolase [Myxococcales bacterium]
MSARDSARRAAGPLAWAALACALTTCGAQDDDAGPAGYAVDLADEIPMTGRPDARFAEVDLVMRQFMKWRCVGAGTLAIAYKGRRVYKRGFGRMSGRASEALYEGCGDDESNPFDPDAALVKPDTPMLIGSLSKAVTAAVARWLIDERMHARGVELPDCTGPLCACSDPPCPATAADVPLLLPEMDLLPEHLASLLRGDAPLPVPLNDGEPCVKGHDPAYADPRWADVTVGNLISHQSGLRRDTPSWFADEDDVMHNLARLRGYDPGDEEAWAAEHALVKLRDPAVAGRVDTSTVWLSKRYGGAPVYFVNNHNARAGHRPIDEPLMLAAGLCLEFNPGVTNYYNQSGGPYEPIDRVGSYSNSAMTLLGRVIDHIQRQRADSTYAAEQGDPHSHWGTALEEFFREQLDIEGGVETPEGIYPYQRSSAWRSPGEQPTPRTWAKGTFYPDGSPLHRPFCVMQDGECTFTPWLEGKQDDIQLRPARDLTRAEDPERGFETVPLWAQEHPLGVAAGGLAVEAPVYLEFAREHGISGSSHALDNGNGDARSEGRPGSHSGALIGGFAYVYQQTGGSALTYLPPIIDGHLVDDFFNLERVMITTPVGVDFIVALNQREDPRCVANLWESGDWCSWEYSVISRIISYGLSRVDWDAVAADLAAEAETVVGMAVDARGRAHYWFADDSHARDDGDPSRFEGPGGAPEDKSSGARLDRYSLPSTRVGGDIVGVAMDAADRVFTWYDDQRVSAGTPHELAAYHDPVRFELAPEHDVYDLVGVAIDQRGVVHAWYADGARSEGTATALARDGAHDFAPATGYAPEDISAIAIQRGAGPDGVDLVWTRYGDGTVSRGTVDDLAAYD